MPKRNTWKPTSGLDVVCFWDISSFPFSKVTAPNAPYFPPFITGPTSPEPEEADSTGATGTEKQRSRAATEESPPSIKEEDEHLTFRFFLSLPDKGWAGGGRLGFNNNVLGSGEVWNIIWDIFVLKFLFGRRESLCCHLLLPEKWFSRLYFLEREGEKAKRKRKKGLLGVLMDSLADYKTTQSDCRENENWVDPGEFLHLAE